MNNGVALSAAERRNALGGAMARLIRDVAATSGVFGTVMFDDDRGDRLELAARLLAQEEAHGRTEPGSRDDSPAGLDAFVTRHRELTAAGRADLIERVGRRWATIEDLFTRPDPLLASPTVAMDVMRYAGQALARDPSDEGRAGLRVALAARRTAVGGSPAGAVPVAAVSGAADALGDD